MSGAQVWGLAAGEFVAQPDFSAGQTETGGWRASQTYVCLESSLADSAFRNKFASGVSPVTLDPSLPVFWQFLGLVDVQVYNQEGGLARLDVTFSGFWASGYGGSETTTPI